MIMLFYHFSPFKRIIALIFLSTWFSMYLSLFFPNAPLVLPNTISNFSKHLNTSVSYFPLGVLPSSALFFPPQSGLFVCWACCTAVVLLPLWNPLFLIPCLLLLSPLHLSLCFAMHLPVVSVDKIPQYPP